MPHEVTGLAGRCRAHVRLNAKAEIAPASGPIAPVSLVHSSSSSSSSVKVPFRARSRDAAAQHRTCPPECQFWALVKAVLSQKEGLARGREQKRGEPAPLGAMDRPSARRPHSKATGQKPDLGLQPLTEEAASVSVPNYRGLRNERCAKFRACHPRRRAGGAYYSIVRPKGVNSLPGGGERKVHHPGQMWRSPQIRVSRFAENLSSVPWICWANTSPRKEDGQHFASRKGNGGRRANFPRRFPTRRSWACSVCGAPIVDPQPPERFPRCVWTVCERSSRRNFNQPAGKLSHPPAFLYNNEAHRSTKKLTRIPAEKPAVVRQKTRD